jgi:hypothetical protein
VGGGNESATEQSWTNLGEIGPAFRNRVGAMRVGYERAIQPAARRPMTWVVQRGYVAPEDWPAPVLSAIPGGAVSPPLWFGLDGVVPSLAPGSERIPLPGR